jgi:hypothetical protein
VRGDRGADRRLVTGAVLCALALGLVFTRVKPETYDSDVMLQVTESMLHRRSFAIERDIFQLNPPYSVYGLGMSLLMAVPYALAERVGGDPVSAAMDTNAIVYAAAIGVVFVLARRLGLSQTRALVVTALVALTTNLLPYTATGFSEPGVALAIAIGLVAVVRVADWPWAGPLAGAAAGFALLLRSDSLVLVVPWLALAVFLCAPDRVRATIGYSAGFFPFFVGWALYNNLRFGAPWRLGYANNPFNHDPVTGVTGLLFSPGRGLFIYVPIAIVALLGLALAWRRRPILVALCVVLLVARVLFYAPWWAWNGGWCWGPRFLVPAMPALAVGFAEIVRRARNVPRRSLIAFGVIAAVSFLVQLAGATVAYEESRLTEELDKAQWDASPQAVSQENQRIIDDALFDWRLFAVTDHTARMLRGENLAGKVFHAPVRTGRIAVIVGLAVLGSLVTAAALRRPRDESEPSSSTERPTGELTRSPG